MDIINQKVKEGIIDSYYYRIKAFGIDLDKKDLKNTLASLPQKDLVKFFLDMMKGNEQEIITVLNRLNIKATDKEENINSLKEQVKKSLNLSSITEFSNNRKAYFKFKDAEGNIFVVQNLGNDSKQLFLDILNNKDVTNSPDGKKNAAEIFKFLERKKFIDIPMENSNNVDPSKHPKNQIAIVKEIEKQFPSKQIVANIDENLYIVKGNNEEDIILAVIKENNRYKVTPLVQKTYGSKPDEKSKKDVQDSYETPNDVIIELENNEEIGMIIENCLNNNLSDEEINKNVIQTINEKYPKFRNIPLLGNIILTLINRIKNKRNTSSQSNSLGGKQYVLTNHKVGSYNADSDAA